MANIRELYQEIIREHYAKPRNYRKMEAPSCSLEGYNPLCGDRIVVFVKLEGDVVADIAFQSSGCAISKASASMMTESVKGKSTAEIEELYSIFHRLITRGPVSEEEREKLGDLELLEGVSEYPTRVKCATLGWHTLRGALEGQRQTVSTE